MKKTVAITMLVVMLVLANLFGAVALARYTYIERVVAALSIVGGKATVDGTVSTFDPNTIKIKLELERKLIGGSSWSPYNSWNDSKANTTRFSTAGSCTVTSGYVYRAKVTGTVNGESAVAYSSEITY